MNSDDDVRTERSVAVIGAGLAGSEAAYQLAVRGLRATLYEKRPSKMTPAHTSGGFAELVCSNSLGGDEITSPAGILKQELRMAGSVIMRAADVARVPAGGALAVDRAIFSAAIEEELARAGVEVVREEVASLPSGPVIAALGPLMSGALADEITAAVGRECMAFYDAAAPIVTASSVDMASAYMAGRYGQAADYINCPMTKDIYESFVDALVKAERSPLHEIDEAPSGAKRGRGRYFEGCLPVEVMAERGVDTLRFGPMRPVGLPDPRTGREPYAVLQLRRDDRSGTIYNLVGCQTNIKWGPQEEIFRMIPALANAEFVRKGVMHRNAFVCAPISLDPLLRPMRDGALFRDDVFLAGQITGVEGYVESAAMGLVAAINAAHVVRGASAPEWPRETVIGSLLRYLREAEPDTFQPMNANLGILPSLETKKKMKKKDRCIAHAERSRDAMERFLKTLPTA